MRCRLAGSAVDHRWPPLRPRQANIRVLFVFDPWRSAILLVAGDKTGQWHTWYEHAIPQAEQLYEVYLQERAKAEEEARE
jgi:hypothetical protein